MCIRCDGLGARPAKSSFACDDASPKTSRRKFLKASATVAAASAAIEVPRAQAQTRDVDRLRNARRILIKNGCILSMDKQVGDFAKGDVLVEGGKIREVRPNISASDAVIVDATNRIVTPGFIDTHHHFHYGPLRNILSNGLLRNSFANTPPRDAKGAVRPEYMKDIDDHLTSFYNADDAYAAALVSALGMIDMGTTSAVDTSQVCHTPEHTDACIRGLKESGMRVLYAYSRGMGPRHQYPQDLTRIQKQYFNSTDQLLTLALGGSLDKGHFSAARKSSVRMVSHGVNNRTEKSLHELQAEKLPGAGDIYIHCTQLSDDSWKVIRDTGGKVSLSVPIEMHMGHGMPGIQGALDFGIRPSLSSDVATTMAPDAFTLMRHTMNLQRLSMLQRADKKDPTPTVLLTTREVMEFATIEGARSMGLDSKTGSLTPGKDADILLLDAGRLNVWPLNNATGCVVTLMGTGNVESVFVAGKVKKWKGALVGVDEARVRKLVADVRDGILKRANFPMDLFG